LPAVIAPVEPRGGRSAAVAGARPSGAALCAPRSGKGRAVKRQGKDGPMQLHAPRAWTTARAATFPRAAQRIARRSADGARSQDGAR